MIRGAGRLPRRLRTLFAALAAGAAAALPAHSAAAQEASLFRSDSVLALTLRTDLRALLRDRDTATAVWRAATLTYAGPDSAVTVPLRVRTRGIYRRAHCDLPPLRLRFDEKDVRGTLLDQLRRPKLVTHCFDRGEYEQNLLLEYAIYRAWQLLSPYSFAARLLRVTYEDSAGRVRPVTRYGIVTEDPERLAQRVGATILAQNDVRLARVNRPFAAALGVFQYLIGNTDWGVPTRHNVELLRTADSAIYAVPYDFDWSGIIDASYARPARFLGTQRVTDRVFRGVCQPLDDLVPTLERFEALRDSLTAVFRSVPDLEPRTLAWTLRYLDGFYTAVADRTRFWRREVEPHCML